MMVAPIDLSKHVYLASKLRAEPPPEWVAKPYFVAGAITELSGQAKKAGKSTFLRHVVKAVSQGSPFLGNPCTAGPVLYLTEEFKATLRESVERTGLLDAKNVYFLPWASVWDVPWSRLTEALIPLLDKLRPRLLIIDTLPQFAVRGGDIENDAGRTLELMGPLQRIAYDRGICVVIVRHERKGGGEAGQAARGSTAIGGAVDIVMSIRRSPGPNKSHRNIFAFSRFVDTPEKLRVTLTDTGFEQVERKVDTADAILGAFNGKPLDVKSVVEKSKLSQPVVARGIRRLYSLGLLRMENGKYILTKDAAEAREELS